VAAWMVDMVGQLNGLVLWRRLMDVFPPLIITTVT
jgi:hypothetical protein